MLDIIRSRSSIRTFALEPVPEEKMRQLESVVKEVRTGPFGHTGRFGIVVLGEKENTEVNNFSTYGVIKNPYAYLVGAVPRRNRSLVDYGYLFQRILLEATKLGLGTCWLGGTFNRSAVSKVFPLQPEEIIPAVSPIGIPAEKKSLVDGILRWSAASKHRKPWEQLFFTYETLAPYPKRDDPLGAALEGVQLAPSAVNRQPWRVLLEENKAHFCIDKRVDRGPEPVRFVELDLGIALYHFEAVLVGEGITGHWQCIPISSPKEWEYVISWVREK